jgi:hypothetical protein
VLALLAGCAGCSSSSSAGSGLALDGGAGDDATATNDGGGAADATPGGDGSVVGAAGACADLGAAVCARLEACAPFLLQLTYGNAATCAARYAAACTPALGANGTTATPTQLEACVQAVNAETCDDALDNAELSACDFMGTLADGAVAGSGLQCQAGYCPPISGSACCQCTARVGVGSACSIDKDCSAGLICYQSACTKPAASGATCSTSQPCLYTDACIGGTCQPALTNGATCQTTFDCDFDHGWYCNAQTLKCAQAQAAGGGSPCGNINGNFIACSAGGQCINGACMAAAADGAACNAQSGPPCMQPAQCVMGNCMLPSPSMCH